MLLNSPEKGIAITNAETAYLRAKKLLEEYDNSKLIIKVIADETETLERMKEVGVR